MGGSFNVSTHMQHETPPSSRKLHGKTSSQTLSMSRLCGLRFSLKNSSKRPSSAAFSRAPCQRGVFPPRGVCHRVDMRERSTQPTYSHCESDPQLDEGASCQLQASHVQAEDDEASFQSSAVVELALGGGGGGGGTEGAFAFAFDVAAKNGCGAGCSSSSLRGGADLTHRARLTGTASSTGMRGLSGGDVGELSVSSCCSFLMSSSNACKSFNTASMLRMQQAERL